MGMLDKFMLTEKTVLITGGAGNIGKAVASDMAEMGADIVIADCNQDEAAAFAAQLCEKGSNSIAVGADITKPDQVQRLVDTVVKAYGKIDVLYNNAGRFAVAPAEDMEYQAWLDMLDVCLNGVFLTTQRVGREMIKRGRGSIVTTASMSGVIVNYPRPQVAYNTAKAGLIHMMRSFAMEWAPYGIRVNTVSPGYIDNPRIHSRISEDLLNFFNKITPMHRMADEHEISGAVIYLAGDAATYTTGINLIVDGGYTIL
ncbi:MAG: SDR family oxidoreductase [Clostridiales Family XIII bacterium]|jgi:NAD(P)-dependent dehydrogenase (short-subunit alcohol dehydrogenase family)|nr:SDR family oxidoreductase [Clostridiales Family XIII bacterium]